MNVLESKEGYLKGNYKADQKKKLLITIPYDKGWKIKCNGKIIKATSNNTEMINKILDTDEGARYIGEFAFGLNPYVERPIGDTLFDEKIKGSFHFTPGDALEESDNGNRSSIHWDIVNIQRKEYGGGEIYFDDILIRKDGIFVLPELQALNPENLI